MSVFYYQCVVFSIVKNMIFYTWNVVSTLHPACIMSCISQQRKPFQGLYTPGLFPGYQGPDILLIPVWGHCCCWSMVEWWQVKMGPHILILPKIIITTKLQNYFDQLKSMNMWVTNQTTLWWAMCYDCKAMEYGGESMSFMTGP